MTEQDIDTLLLNILMNVADEKEIAFFSSWVADEKNSDYFDKVKQTWNLFELKSSEIPVNETGRFEYLTTIRKAKERVRRMVITSVAVAAAMITVSFWIWEIRDNTILPVENQITTINSPSNKAQLNDNDVSIISTSPQGEVLKITKLSGETLKISSNDLSKIIKDDSTSVHLNTLIVPKGKRIEIILSDGTRMWVNSESKVTYPAIFSKDRRALDVVGNVFFDVAKDSSRPFEVNTNDIKTIALGTQFEVNNYEGQACSISLMEGKVSVENGHYTMIINPSEQIIAQTGTEKLIKQKFNIRDFGLWRDDILVFDNEPISDIIKKLNRWHNIEIVDKTKGVKNIRFTGKLNKGSIDYHLKIITENINIKFTKEGEKIIMCN